MILVTALLAPALTVQTAETSLVPPEPLPLGGYTARQGALFEPGGEDLKSRVQVWTQGETQVALVSLEMLTVPESLVSAVRDRIPKTVRLMMVATHTHCAPDSQMLNQRMTFRIPGIEVFSRQWHTWYADKIAESINTALKADSQPVTLTYQTAETTYNRGRREGAKPNNHVDLLKSSTTGLLHYSAHATLFGEDRLKLSGDWPGQIMQNTNVLVLPGAIGDVSPAATADSAEGKVKQMAEGLLADIKKATAKETGSTLAFATQKIDLPPAKPHPDFAKENNINDAIAGLLVNRFAPAEAELTALLLGETLIIGVPGEPTSELGRQIQARAAKAGFNRVWVVSHCNGWVGYILMPEDYDKGGYEATLAMHGRDLSSKILEAVDQLVAQFPPERIGWSLKLRSNTTRFIETTASLAASFGS